MLEAHQRQQSSNKSEGQFVPGYQVARGQGLAFGVTKIGVGMPGLGVSEGVGLPKGAGVGNTRVGVGATSRESLNMNEPTKLSTTLTTTTTLKMVVMILAPRLLRRL
jgi:hypothetical protein